MARLPGFKANVTGGAKFHAMIKRAKRAQATGVRQVDVGFFATAKYPDGTPVPNVAAWNEFGTQKKGGGGVHIPQRPFFRHAMVNIKDDVKPVLIQHVDPKTMVVTPRVAGLVGLTIQKRIQLSITQLTTPPNAPSTIKKKGSSNPLIDTGVLRKSVAYTIKR